MLLDFYGANSMLRAQLMRAYRHIPLGSVTQGLHRLTLRLLPATPYASSMGCEPIVSDGLPS